MGPSAVRSPATLATWTNDPPPLRAASGSACRQTSIAAVDRRDRAVPVEPAHPGPVDHVVEPAAAGEHLGERPHDRCLVGDVELPVGVPGGCRWFPDVHREHLGAAPGQVGRDAAAHPTAGAGDERHPAAERPSRLHGQVGISGRIWPPSTTRLWPVTNEARSDARYRTALPMSCGSPSRCSGIRASMAWIACAPRSASPSVRMLPGATALTVMPNGATSIAAVRMNPFMPALVAP